MKKIIVLCLVFLIHTGYSQSNTFTATWNFIKLQTERIDTLCSSVKKQRISANMRRSRIKLRSASVKGIRQTIITKRKCGQIIVMHKYKMGQHKKIKLVEADRKIQALAFCWKSRVPDSTIVTRFTQLNDTAWIFTYRKKVLTPEGYAHATSRKAEIIRNWSAKR